MTLTVSINKKPQLLMSKEYFEYDFAKLDKYKDMFKYENDTKEVIEQKVATLLDSMVYPLRPKLYKQLYFLERFDADGKLISTDALRLSLKPIGKHRVHGVDLLRQLTITIGENMYSELVESVKNWFAFYNEEYCSAINANVFTEKFHEIATNGGIKLPFNVRFVYGQGLKAVDNFNITIGLPSEVLGSLEYNPLFFPETADEYTYANELAIFTNYISTLSQGGLHYAVKNSLFTQRYGIITREFGVQIATMVRHKLAKDVTKLRKGLNVYRGEVTENAHYVAILDVQTVTEEEAAEHGDAILTVPNTKPTNGEKEANQLLYAIYFMLKPTAKNLAIHENETLRTAIEAVTLADIVATIEVAA